MSKSVLLKIPWPFMILISASEGLRDETPVLHIFVTVTSITHVSNVSPLTQVIYWHKYL